MPENCKGTHYRIQVNKQSDFAGVMVQDSGKTALDSAVCENEWSENISYGGLDLEAKVKYWWRIKFWYDSYEMPWSGGPDASRIWEEEEAHFTMGEEEEEEQPIISLIG